MNLRPPGPQPGALPDCATPRGLRHCTAAAAGASCARRFAARPNRVGVRRQCEHAFLEPSARCTRCCELRPAAEFRLREGSKKTWDVLCRSCRSAYGKEHYAVNRQRYIDHAHARKRALALERTRYPALVLRGAPMRGLRGS